MLVGCVDVVGGDEDAVTHRGGINKVLRVPQHQVARVGREKRRASVRDGGWVRQCVALELGANRGGDRHFLLVGLEYQHVHEPPRDNAQLRGDLQQRQAVAVHPRELGRTPRPEERLDIHRRQGPNLFLRLAAAHDGLRRA